MKTRTTAPRNTHKGPMSTQIRKFIRGHGLASSGVAQFISARVRGRDERPKANRHVKIATRVIPSRQKCNPDPKLHEIDANEAAVLKNMLALDSNRDPCCLSM